MMDFLGDVLDHHDAQMAKVDSSQSDKDKVSSESPDPVPKEVKAQKPWENKPKSAPENVK